MINRNRVRLSKLALGLAVALAAAPAFAQSTSSALGGRISDAAGQPVTGADVAIVHVESGTVSHATTDASGRYLARGLRVGGPYSVTITKDGKTETREGVYLQLAEVASLDAKLGVAATDIGSVVVMGGATSVFSSDNKGVGTSVSGRQLELAPQTNRSLDDIARLDPRIQVTDAGDGSISVAGVNNRYNNISVDGMSQGDPFGLNANGLPYIGSPISVDTIAAYDLKVSDYDVGSDTVGATVNAVTKSGTNEFHGSVYTALRDSDWMGNLDGNGYTGFDSDRTWGATLGGRLVKDKLFFFASFEKQTIKNFGGSSTSDGIANGDVTQQDVADAIEIANSLGMFPGTYGSTGVNLENKRYLAKLDWNINDSHRASLTYQRTNEFRPSPYDAFSDTVVLSSHWYNLDNVTRNTSLQLFSDWSENFSTEVKISKQLFDQVNGNPINQPEVEVETAGGGSIFIGEDNNRHENQINTKRLSAMVSGTYYAGDHTIKGGFDYMRHDVFNLYGRDLHGSYVFASLEDFANGDYDVYNLKTPAPGYSIEDTASALVYSQFSPYLQDSWAVNDNLSVTYGVRVNIPRADKAPEEAPGFEAAFGFPNDYKLGSDNKVILPRFAFNYQFDTERSSQLRGGIGAFQSVPPFVWLANPYQNNGGVTALTYRSTDPANAEFSADPYNQNIPAVGSPSNLIDVIDPDFKLPTVWKFSLAYDSELPWYDLVGSVELVSIRARDAAMYQALNIGEVQTTLADGRESYWCTLGGSTSSSNKNCGRNPAFSNQSTLLTNTDKGASTSVTFSLDKPLANGWYGKLSYTHTNATEVGSDANSNAWSSYQYVSRLNPNDEIAKTASREIRDSVKLSLGWERAFFGDYKTSITAFYYGRTGLPYTWTINGDPNGDGIFQDPAYIPTIDDTNVSYGSATAEQIAAFHAFIDGDSYLSSHRGEVAERNAGRLPWISQLDLGLQQELPGFFAEHKAVVRLDIYNFLNMLNNDWGVTEEIGGFDTRYLARLGSNRADGGYVYNLGTTANPTWQELRPYEGRVPRVVSRWSALVTLRYEF